MGSTDTAGAIGKMAPWSRKMRRTLRKSASTHDRRRAGRVGQGAGDARTGRSRQVGLLVKYSVDILERRGRMERLRPRSASVTCLPQLHKRVVVSGNV